MFSTQVEDEELQAALRKKRERTESIIKTEPMSRRGSIFRPESWEVVPITVTMEELMDTKIKKQ